MNDGECKQCDNGNNLEKSLCLCLVLFPLVEVDMYSIRAQIFKWVVIKVYYISLNKST